MPLKILHSFFVLLRRGFRFKCSEIPSLARLWIFLPRIQPIPTVLKLADHATASLLCIANTGENAPENSLVEKIACRELAENIVEQVRRRMGPHRCLYDI